MRHLILTCALCVFTTGAFAQTSIPKEIVGYNKIAVTFSEDAKKCNLEDPTAYKMRLGEKLAGIGIKQNDQSVMTASLVVSGQKFGATGGYCVSLVELSFQTALSKDNIVTGDKNVRRAVDKIGIIPIIVYERGMMAVQPQTEPANMDKDPRSTRSKRAALKMIDGLVGRLDSDRK